MDKLQLLNIVSTFTKEDWQQFDNLKNQCFQPTQAEIDAQNAQMKQDKTNYLINKLSIYGITFKEPTSEAGWLDLFSQYIKGTPDCREWLGADLDKKVIDYMFFAKQGDAFTVFYNLVSSLEI